MENRESVSGGHAENFSRAGWREGRGKKGVQVRDESPSRPRIQRERVCHRQPASWRSPLQTASIPPPRKGKIYSSFREEFEKILKWVTGFAGDRILVSFKGNCIRSVHVRRSGNLSFWQTPEPAMAIFAVSFMHNNAKNNAEMQQQGRQKKPARHLRILRPQ